MQIDGVVGQAGGGAEDDLDQPGVGVLLHILIGGGHDQIGDTVTIDVIGNSHRLGVDRRGRQRSQQNQPRKRPDLFALGAGESLALYSFRVAATERTEHSALPAPRRTANG
ncbi:hypothetical protein HDA32_002247 [Spinactinospora alkalitolerans]|uniref:Uncharacterized protein n=1 Tax=Spinactinospora alkalitolerans TaxID=687207 RepID=A0A852TUZ9_9ACTN|nr:hypothetical protein [Spinactinospora alkalitolerans]NYE47127.1 hypothetical protein [Spinactinospora alkalitolerans]